MIHLLHAQGGIFKIKKKTIVFKGILTSFHRRKYNFFFFGYY